MPRRPTAEQRSTYEANFQESGHPEFLKEVSVAGDFLADCMAEAGFSDEEIRSACFTLGRLGFSGPAWDAFDTMWERAEKQAAYGSTPVEQDVPEPSDLLITYLKQVRHYCGDKGIYPQPLLHKNAEGKVTLAAVAADGNECVRLAQDALRDGATELVFGMDRYALPGQGLEFDNFVTVVWFVGGEFYTAVIDYVPAEDAEDQVVRDPDWDNNWWNNQMRDSLIPLLREAVG